MHPKLKPFLAALVLGGALAGCGGASSPESPSDAQITAALRYSATELDPETVPTTEHEMEDAVSRLTSLLDELRQVPALQPLFAAFDVQNPLRTDDDDEAYGLIRLLRSVRITVSDGTLTLSNRATGGVIYSAPLSDLASGTFHPEDVPGATGTPPPVACAYTYAPWSACAGGVQTRTVASATPAGCTGAPVLSQACTGSTPPPATCTSFTYSAWGACPSSGTQTRTVTASAPSGCTGGSPVTTQSCTYVPPVTTCSSFTYSAWGACASSGTQTRTVTASAPSGCTGGSPVTTQSCTYTAPNPVTSANIVSSCTACHGLTSNTTVFKAGGYSKTGATAAQWLSTVNSMVSMGASLAPGTTAQNYADYLANVP